MNIEAYREYCLSLGADVEEKLPFVKFKNGEGVLVFYVCGHMFAFFDCNDYHVISLKCQPECIDELKAQYGCIGNPYNESPKHWIGIDPHSAPTELLRDLTRNSYEIVKAKYSKKKMKKLFTLALAAMLFAACGQKKEIPYEVAHNYFVRNDVTGPVPAKIDSSDEFERYFGMAAFMGKNGQPTPIVFEKQFAIAVVLPETNHSTELYAESLTDDGSKLLFTYRAEVADKENTWTQVPVLLIFVDRQYERESVELHSN